MFTGIVDALGQIEAVAHNEGAIKARISCPYPAGDIALGASISCDGVCLSVTRVEAAGEGAVFDVDISAHTLGVTNLGEWKTGRRINLERAARLGDEISGHIVAGHIDGVVRITAMTAHGDDLEIRFETAEELLRFIAPKGSLCLDGTALTINHVEGNGFDVNLVPHTLGVTHWAERKIGDKINIEVDLLARYLARLREFDHAS